MHILEMNERDSTVQASLGGQLLRALLHVEVDLCDCRVGFMATWRAHPFVFEEYLGVCHTCRSLLISTQEDHRFLLRRIMIAKLIENRFWTSDAERVHVFLSMTLPRSEIIKSHGITFMSMFYAPNLIGLPSRFSSIGMTCLPRIHPSPPL